MRRPRLTKKVAEQFRSGEITDLYAFATMDDDAAAVLAKHQGALRLGVLELSHTAAEALAQHAGGSLHLAGLRFLTVDAAKALAKHQGDLLLGVEQLSKAVAEALAEHTGGALALERLQFLNEGAANALAFHKGSQYKAHDYGRNLSIGSCFYTPIDLRAARLTLRLAKGAAKALARGGTGRLSLSVTSVSDEEAESLAQLEHLLHLPRLEALTNTSLAHKLVYCEEGESEDVFFDELKTLSNEVATALTRFPAGCLYFEGLEAISDEVAETFSKALETGALGGLYISDNIPCSPLASRMLLAAGANEMPCAFNAQPKPKVNGIIYLRRVWADVDGVLDLHVSFQTADEMVSALVKAMNYARAEKDSLGGSLRDFYAEAVDCARGKNDSLGGSLRDFLIVLADGADSARNITVDEFEAQEQGTPVCDDFEVVVDEADRIHFLPFQLRKRMSAEDWSAVSSLWHPWLANAPLDEDDRNGWQICLTKAEFLGQPA